MVCSSSLPGVLLLTCIISSGYAQQGWVARQSNTRNPLLAVHYVPEPGESIAVGGGYVIRRSTDGRMTWQEGIDPYYFFDIAFTDAGLSSAAVAVGASGRILRPLFSAVKFINSQRGYVGSSTLGRVYLTTDGGTSWTNTSTPPPMVRVFDLAFSSPDPGHGSE